jgi:D-alanyl-D-alanine carboxypeptidase
MKKFKQKNSYTFLRDLKRFDLKLFVNIAKFRDFKNKIGINSFILCLSCSALFAQNPPQYISDSLQSILNHSIDNNSLNPGVVLSVHVPGQWTWSGASGKAINGMTVGKPETNASPQSKFRIGSISKTFISTAIMMLEEQNLLNINDTIGKYLRTSLLNDTINSSEPVKIRHLLNHTSGIDNSASNMTCQQNALANLTANYSLETAIYCGASQGEIFPPEFAWAYSNTNYSILAMIIEIVSGQSSSEYIYNNIILPLGLTNTAVPTTNEISSEHMGCYWDLGSLLDMTIVNPTLYWGWADIVSTTEDLNTFYKALLAGEIVNQNSLTKMKTMYAGTYDYGLGLDFYEIENNKPYFGHTGEVGNSSSLWFADLATTNLPNGYFMKTYINTANTNNLSKNNLLKVYPNPSNKSIHVQFESSSEKQITIYDLMEKNLLTLNSNLELTTINLENFKSGLYLIEVINEGEKYLKIIVKE